MGEHYTTISDLEAYVKHELLGGAAVILAEKTARIAARPAVPGEVVASWSVASDGSALLEKEVSVPRDGKLYWTATKVDDSGAEVVDQNGNRNQWVLTDSTFREKYEAEPMLPGLYRPISGVQRFLPLREPLHIRQNGSEWFVDAGGCINITREGHFYPVSQRDFHETYRVIPSADIVPFSAAF